MGESLFACIWLKRFSVQDARCKMQEENVAGSLYLAFFPVN